MTLVSLQTFSNNSKIDDAARWFNNNGITDLLCKICNVCSGRRAKKVEMILPK